MADSEIASELKSVILFLGAVGNFFKFYPADAIKRRKIKSLKEKVEWEEDYLEDLKETRMKRRSK